jgi:transposase
MRGKAEARPDFLAVANHNAAGRADHPLRAIKRRVDAVLQKLSPLFDELCAEGGRGGIPPGQLLKARVLTALYSVRSERLFCEQLGCNLLWVWFPDREPGEGSFGRSVFAKNYERVLSADVAGLFFAGVHELSRQERWTSDGRFSADGTLIESWAIRKRVEEIFGWMKTVGGLRRSRYRGMERTQAWGHFVAATHNLPRMARLEAG